MRAIEPMYGQMGLMTGLAISVLKPGMARVEGVWSLDDRVIIVGREYLSFLRLGLRQPLSIAGEGENSVLHVSSGVIDGPLFGFA